MAGLNLGKVGLKSGRLSMFNDVCTDIHPLSWSGSAVELEDLEDLVDLAVSTEQGFLFS